MYRPTARITIKSGNSFSLFCSYTDEYGNPLPLNDAKIIAELKDQNRQLISVFDITQISDSYFEIRLPQGFDIRHGIYFSDIRIIENNVVRNSDILQINVAEVVTDVKA